MDGCSNTVCDCTAMVPIYLDLSAGQSIFERVSETFIKTIERNTDAGNHILGIIINGEGSKTPEDWETLWDKSTRLHNLSKSNHLYFGRFLNIYNKEFAPGRAEELSRIMSARCEKARIIYEDNMRKSEHGFKKESAAQTNARLNIAEKSLTVSKRSWYIAIAALFATVTFSLATLLINLT